MNSNQNQTGKVSLWNRPAPRPLVWASLILAASPVLLIGGAATLAQFGIIKDPSAQVVNQKTTIDQRLQTSPRFKQVFENNVRKCVELEVSPLAFLDDRKGNQKAVALQQASQEAKPACRRDEEMRWQRAPSSYLVQKYG